MSVNLTNTAIRLLGVFPFEVSERLALIILCWRADENGETRMNKSELARQTGLSRPTVRKTVSRLEMMGLVSGPRLTVGVRALVKLLARSQMENGLPSEGEEDGKRFATFGDVAMENGLPSECKDVCQKMEKGLPPYRQDYKTRTNARACEESSSVSGEGAPTGDGQTRVVKAAPAPSTAPLTIRVEAAEVQDKKSLEAFLKEYPKRAMNRLVVCAEWAALEAEGFTGRQLLGAMREARMSKQWSEDGVRYVPRAEIFLHDRRFEDFLPAAAERGSVKSQAEREAEEREAARRQAAIDEIVREEFFGGEPVQSVEDIRAREAKRPEAEKIYEERKRAGTLKPVVMACEEQGDDDHV